MTSYARAGAIVVLALILPAVAAAAVDPEWNLPPSVVAEATGPDGAIVTYTASAKNPRGKPLTISCAPPSGSRFPLGQTTVTCTVVEGDEEEEDAGDRKSFPVIVRDTIAPSLTPPSPVELSSPGGAPVPASDPRVAAFLAGARATDAVTPSVAVRNDAPASFPVGATPVTFTAVDGAGNAATARSTVTVVAAPVGDLVPPEGVSGARAATGSRLVRLTWTRPADADFDRVEITRSARGVPATVVYRGAGARFTDTSVRNGVLYAYTLRTYDAAGNAGAEVTLSVRPRATRLLTPLNGAAVTHAPVLRWLGTRGATYYNVQLWRNGRKILSAWPPGPTAPLPGRWSYGGRRYSLTPGTYKWYVWPGFGDPGSARYGRLVGSRTFVVLAP